jgi:arylformamidase
MTMWDITRPIHEDMPAWPGTPPPAQRWLERIDEGAVADVSEWTLNAHAGTHLDAPSHFLPHGPDLEALGLSALVGPCVVCDYADLRPAERVLVKLPAGVGLTLEQAQSLLAQGVRLVGVDALSVETEPSVAAGAAVHRALLGAGVALVEGLLLDDVPSGEYQLVALPLRLLHSEASPLRAVLFRENSGATAPASGAQP